ncbi:unnamed protein product, partial [Iphiclides podalirius]
MLHNTKQQRRPRRAHSFVSSQRPSPRRVDVAIPRDWSLCRVRPSCGAGAVECATRVHHYILDERNRSRDEWGTKAISVRSRDGERFNGSRGRPHAEYPSAEIVSVSCVTFVD